VDLIDGAADAPPGVDIAVSGLTGQGLERLSGRLRELVGTARAEQPERTPYVVVRPGRDPFTVTRQGGGFRVAGPKVERWVAETDLNDPRQVVELQRKLIRAGVERRLAEVGADPGDEVTIGSATFEFFPGSPGDAEPGGREEGSDGDET
jgi:GTP-binding protein